MKVYCRFSLESPRRGDSNVYTQYTIFIIVIISPQIILNLQIWDFVLGTQERVRNSRGKRAISVRATEVLLFLLGGAVLQIRRGNRDNIGIISIKTYLVIPH